jgi:hypothetical protein
VLACEADLNTMVSEEPNCFGFNGLGLHADPLTQLP